MTLHANPDTLRAWKARSKPLERGSGLQRRKEMPRVKLAVVDGSGPPVLTLPKRPRDTGPSRAVRILVLQRDGYACVCCGRSIIGQPYSLQHRKRRSQGGSSTPPNLITVFGDGTAGCHQRIDSRIKPADEAKGYTVRSRKDPALVPVMVFSEHGSGVTVWLTEDGQYSTEPPRGAA